MSKKLFFTALSLALVLGLAAPAQAEIIDYGYGSQYQYGTGYGATYGYGSTYGTQYQQYPYTTSIPAAYPTGTTINRDLTIGSYGTDVQALENFLRLRGYLATQSVGYFTVATRDAVARFQAANGIFPASGYFGAITRAYYNALALTVQNPYANQYPYGTQYPYVNQNPYGTMYPYSYQTGCPAGRYAVYYGGQLGCVSTNRDNDDDDDDNDLDGGRATLRSFSFDGEDTVLREGERGVEVAHAEFRVSGGDVEVERVAFRFESIGSGNTDRQPWNVFDTLRLVCDGDEAEELDVDSSGDWSRDGDAYIVRFDDIDDCIIREGDTAELTLEVDVNNSVSGADNSNVEWEIAVEEDGIEVTDAEGDDHEIGEDSDTVRIVITD